MASNISSGMSTEGMILQNDSMTVLDGGIANSTTVKTGGRMTVLYGGIANITTVNSSGILGVGSGGTANNTTVNSNGWLFVASGGTATNVIAENGAGLTIYLASETYVQLTYRNRPYEIRNEITDYTINDGAIYVCNGAKASKTTIKSNGSLIIEESGDANDVIVHSGGNVYLSGTAVGIKENGGYVYVANIATASFIPNSFSGVILGSGLSATIHSGTTAFDMTISSGGRCFCHGGLASKTKVLNYGSLFVASGGTADNAVVSRGELIVASGGTVNHTSVYVGNLHVSSGGIANDTVVSGSCCISSGGVANNTMIQWGILDVLGTATALEISDGRVMVGSLGSASGAVVHSGGQLFVSTGGTLTGQVTIGKGATVTMSAESELLFDISGRAPNTSIELLNDLSQINGTPDYVITASEGQLDGQYYLARGVSSFLDTITVQGANKDYLGTLTVGETLTVGNAQYQLTLDNNILALNYTRIATIDSIVPTVGDIKANTTEPAQSVTVTAVFSDNVGVKYSLYRIGDDSSWLDYIDGVTVTENGTVFFKAVDTSGNESEVASYKVSNIDRGAPSIPSELSAVVVDQTVVLLWNASLDSISGVKEYVVNYSCNGQDYMTHVTNSYVVLEIADSGTWSWSVQAVDFAGNESAVVYGEDFTVTENVTPGPQPEPEPEERFVADGDIDGNGVSDVMFQWTGGDHQVGFWMNGTSEWQGQGRSRSEAWNVLGAYDMNADGKADMLMTGKDSFLDMTGTMIGYYDGAVDTDDNWHTVGFLINTNDWVNEVGNLTGTKGANSIVWYAPELYALGAWTDGTSNWVTMTGSFGGDDWKLVGCGDFDGDGKDSVVMAYNGGELYYAVGIDGRDSELAKSDSGWAVCAIGDFSGDGKDDIVAFHKETGIVAMWGDGSTSNWSQLGQLDAKDWFVVGCGDYNGDQRDDLLVRQYSTGMLGYYSGADTTQWNVLGYGVGMDWTVIA